MKSFLFDKTSTFWFRCTKIWCLNWVFERYMLHQADWCWLVLEPVKPVYIIYNIFIFLTSSKKLIPIQDPGSALESAALSLWVWTQLTTQQETDPSSKSPLSTLGWSHEMLILWSADGLLVMVLRKRFCSLWASSRIYHGAIITLSFICWSWIRF